MRYTPYVGEVVCWRPAGEDPQKVTVLARTNRQHVPAWKVLDHEGDVNIAFTDELRPL